MDTTTQPLASIGIESGRKSSTSYALARTARSLPSQDQATAARRAFKKLPPCVVGMEACLSAHFVSRALRQLGHQPRIIPAIYVKPFVKGQKNDYNDAEAIAEAALRPSGTQPHGCIATSWRQPWPTN
ncbi:transposase [Bradyrhizobium sp. LB1.3]